MTAELEMPVLRPDDVDFVDEGEGRFDVPVVRRRAVKCAGCGLTLEADAAGRYCFRCVAALEY